MAEPVSPKPCIILFWPARWSVSDIDVAVRVWHELTIDNFYDDPHAAGWKAIDIGAVAFQTPCLSEDA